VVSNFIVQNLTGEAITIYGDGSHTRSFCYVDDLIDGLIKLMDTPDTLAGPVNLGDTLEITILELAEMIIRLTGSKSKISYKPIPSDDPCRRRPDICLAKSRLNWWPTTILESGLVKMIEYFKENEK